MCVQKLVLEGIECVEYDLHLARIIKNKANDD